MDLNALQTSLRQFAAERDWQPFHTPKNLATALMVEAAELAEIFQWMTPEQSQAAHQDTMVAERIADEVADVLLYLLQVADHSAVDLKRAVGRKLAKNARKHPPTRPGAPAGVVSESAPQVHVLVDWENVQPRDTDIRGLVPDVTDVWIFHGPAQTRVDAHQASFGDRVTLVPIARAGKNALDFHLSFYMGYIASRRPDARFVVLSNDKGYGPMLEHAAALGFATRHVGFMKERTTRGGGSRQTPSRAPARTAGRGPERASTHGADRKPARAVPAAPAPAPTQAPVAQAPARTGNGRGGRRRSRGADAAPTPVTAEAAALSQAVLQTVGRAAVPAPGAEVTVVELRHPDAPDLAMPQAEAPPPPASDEVPAAAPARKRAPRRKAAPVSEPAATMAVEAAPAPMTPAPAGPVADAQAPAARKRGGRRAAVAADAPATPVADEVPAPAPADAAPADAPTPAARSRTRSARRAAAEAPAAPAPAPATPPAPATAPAPLAELAPPPSRPARGRKTASAKTVAPKAAARAAPAAPAPAPVPTSASGALSAAIDRVRRGLQRSANKPARLARLEAAIASYLGRDADPALVPQVLKALADAGLFRVDQRQTVHWAA